MAVYRSIFNPKNIVLPVDSAIDETKTDYSKYVESSFDNKHLSFNEGEKPTYFRIRQLTSKHRDYVERFITDRERARVIVKCGLIGIENYIILKDDNTEEIINSVENENNRELGSILSDTFLEMVKFNNETLLTLSNIIIIFSETNKKK